MATAPIEQRLWAKVEKRDPDECWPWRGALDDHGYGRIYYNGVNQKAPRVTWQLSNRQPIPDGQVVCHSCDNPQCVNPSHLWLGTGGDNTRDMAAKGRHAMQQRTHCPQGHEYTPQNTMVVRGWRTCRACRNRSEVRRKAARRQGDVR